LVDDVVVAVAVVVTAVIDNDAIRELIACGLFERVI